MNDNISNKMAAHLDTQPSGQPAQPTSRTSKIIEKILLGKREQDMSGIGTQNIAFETYPKNRYLFKILHFYSPDRLSNIREPPSLVRENILKRQHLKN